MLMNKTFLYIYQNREYIVEITYKRMKNIRYRFKDDKFLVSAPRLVSLKQIKDGIEKFAPKLIKKEAFKISPDTIEEVIKSLPFVSECVVVGVEDKKSLSVPMAFIVLKDKDIIFENVVKDIRKKCFEEAC